MSCTGSIKKVMEGKGFGFIECDDGQDDVFMHFSVINNGGSEDMQVGGKVTFDVATDDRSGKTKAANVTLLDVGSGGGGGGGYGGGGGGYGGGKGKGDKGGDKGKGKGKGKESDRWSPY